MHSILLSAILFLCMLGATKAPAQQKVTRTADVVYGRAGGLALTMDVLVPEHQNGAAVVHVISGGWVSKTPSETGDDIYKVYTDCGFTVFAVAHLSQPRAAVPEIMGQIQRAIRFIRHNAPRYGIDPQRIGVTGASAGGHLSICAAVFGRDAPTREQYAAERGLKADQAVDPVDLQSSRVAAVGCFYPPTDFVHFVDRDTNWFDFPPVRNVSTNGSFVATPDSPRGEQQTVLRAISPYYFVTEQTPPILIIHGTQDELIPYGQSIRMIAKLMDAGVPNRLISREGRGHGWPTDANDNAQICQWFVKYLLTDKP